MAAERYGRLCARCGARPRYKTDEVCGTCADDLRQQDLEAEHAADIAAGRVTVPPYDPEVDTAF